MSVVAALTRMYLDRAHLLATAGTQNWFACWAEQGAKSDWGKPVIGFLGANLSLYATQSRGQQILTAPPCANLRCPEPP